MSRQEPLEYVYPRSYRVSGENSVAFYDFVVMLLGFSRVRRERERGEREGGRERERHLVAVFFYLSLFSNWESGAS